MSVTVSITHDRFPEIARKLPAQTKTAVSKAGHDVEGRAKAVVPIDTGALMNSIQTKITDGGFGAEIAPHTDYAVYVEFGTRRMGARPYMTPAGEAVRPAFKAAMEQLLRSLA